MGKDMKVARTAAFLALALAASACSQGNSDNVMSPDANALDPADVNAALGPEVTNIPDMNMAANDMNGVENMPAEEPATNNTTE
jgi:hypothetical protein